MKVIGKIKAILGLDTKKYEKGLDRSKKKTNSFGNTVKKVGGMIAGAFAVEQIGRFAMALKDAASDAQEVESKFNTVFSGIREEANKTAVALGRDYGLATSTAQELLSSTGDLLTGLGATQKTALDLSKTTNQLAVDLASFSNVQGGATRASDAITKAMLGEREMMKAYGVVIRETALTERLAKKGMDDLTGSALLQAKAQETLAMIMEQSKNAIGDYARTSGSFANVQRRLSENFKTMKITLGSSLMPMFQKFAKTLNRTVEYITDNSKEILSWGKAIVKVGAALAAAKVSLIALRAATIAYTTVAKAIRIATMGWAAAQRVLNVALKSNPIGLIVGALATLATWLVHTYQTSEKFRQGLQKMWIRTKQYGKSIWDAIKTYFGSAGKLVAAFVKAMVLASQFKFGKAKDAIVNAFSGVVDDFGDIGKEAREEAENEISKIEAGNRAKEMAKKAGYDSMEAWQQGVEDGINQDKINETTEKSGKEAGKAFARGMKEGFTSLESVVIPDVQMGGMDLGDNVFTQDIDTNVEDIEATSWTQMMEKQKEQLRQTYESMKPILGGLQNAFMAAFTAPGNSMSNFIASLGDFVKQFVMKVASMIAAAAALAAILSVTGLGAAMGMSGGFSGMFQGVSGGGIGSIMTGAIGMAGGGIVPGGYPNDSYPAMLTSGETVIPPNKLPQMGGREELVTRLRGRDIDVVLQRWNKDKSRI